MEQERLKLWNKIISFQGMQNEFKWFWKTDYSGLYISKDTHPEFGKKYIVRFQYDKKRDM